MIAEQRGGANEQRKSNGRARRRERQGRGGVGALVSLEANGRGIASHASTRARNTSRADADAQAVQRPLGLASASWPCLYPSASSSELRGDSHPSFPTYGSHCVTSHWREQPHRPKPRHKSQAGTATQAQALSQVTGGTSHTGPSPGTETPAGAETSSLRKKAFCGGPEGGCQGAGRAAEAPLGAASELRHRSREGPVTRSTSDL